MLVGPIIAELFSSHFGVSRDAHDELDHVLAFRAWFPVAGRRLEQSMRDFIARQESNLLGTSAVQGGAGEGKSIVDARKGQ